MLSCTSMQFLVSAGPSDACVAEIPYGQNAPSEQCRKLIVRERPSCFVAVSTLQVLLSLEKVICRLLLYF